MIADLEHAVKLQVDPKVGHSYNPGQNVLGHLRKLGTKTHFAKLTHILPLKKAWGCCYKGLFLLSPSPPSSVDCVELKLECITSTLHRGRKGGGKMPQFDKLLRWCPKSFDQGYSFDHDSVLGIPGTSFLLLPAQSKDPSI